MALAGANASNLNGVKRRNLSSATDGGAINANGGTVSTFIGNGTTGLNGVTYRVHTFTASDTFTVIAAPRTAQIDFLLVAGGGQGTAHSNGSFPSHQGGGGAGEVVVAYYQAVSAGTYTMTVGGGGSDSSAFGITAKAGGYSRVNATSIAGGSGGGAQSGPDPSAAGASVKGGSDVTVPPLTRYGNAGGSGFNSGWNTSGAGGGGGGAGAVGGSAGNDSPGNGGVGISVAMNGAATFYGGGGAGASWGGPNRTGGTGGGGNSNGSGVGSNGTANTGGGGGAGMQTDTASNGGSGIIIVRYPIG